MNIIYIYIYVYIYEYIYMYIYVISIHRHHNISTHMSYIHRHMAHTRPVYCIPAPPPLAEGVSAGIACTKAPATHAPGASHRTLFLMLTLAPPSISALAAPSWPQPAATWRGVHPFCQQHRARQPCGVVRRVRVGGCVGVGGEGACI